MPRFDPQTVCLEGLKRCGGRLLQFHIGIAEDAQECRPPKRRV